MSAGETEAVDVGHKSPERRRREEAERPARGVARSAPRGAETPERLVLLQTRQDRVFNP